MSGLTCQQIVFVRKLVLSVNRSAACGLGINAFAAYDLDRPIAFNHVICDGINADGGYVLASRVSVDFPESDLLQFFYRYQRLVHTGSSFSRHRRSTASSPVVACASEDVEQPACIKGSDPQWSLQHRGQSDPAAATSRERDVRSRLGALKIAMSCAWPASFLLIRSLFRRAVSVTRHFSILPPYSTTKWT